MLLAEKLARAEGILFPWLEAMLTGRALEALQMKHLNKKE